MHYFGMITWPSWKRYILKYSRFLRVQLLGLPKNAYYYWQPEEKYSSIVFLFLFLFVLWNGISKKYFFLLSAWNDWPNVNVSNEFHLKTCLARVWPCSDSKYYVHLCFFQGLSIYYVVHLILCLNLAPTKVTEEGCQ